MAIEKRKNNAGKVTSYRVEWRVDGRRWKRSFQREAQADAFRSSLVAATRAGESFNVETGEPTSWARTERPSMSWYAFACMYVDLKWADASAKHRAGIAYALTMATFGTLDHTTGPYEPREMRTALRRWAFNTKERPNSSASTREILAWVEKHSLPMSALASPISMRAVLNAATTRLDGQRMAASSNRRHRVILSNALNYAVELGLLDKNPIPGLKWKIVKASVQVDRRSVVNPAQARRLLSAIESQRPSGKLLMPFFATLYFAGLRPEEAVDLRESDATLPDGADEWGELYLSGATPEAGKEWTDSGDQRDKRGLKHRPEGETRPVPIPPELVAILRKHLNQNGTGPGGRIFHGAHGDVLAKSTILRVWRKAREMALSAEEYASPLARRPYDLRHACLSTWLNAGVPPKKVAEWAGNSVEVLHRTYEKCLAGDDEIAKRRIGQVLGSRAWGRIGDEQSPTPVDGQRQPDTDA
ncbi:tyrosine-type recombinase/integrase [Herbidospora cretacea]|uniref:tyrosine-type recombinase/integrase n=1 Tax=Herbidospora cretacea TaxID=28444 RepID=UPI001E396BCC|nr:tyrosine-type recombinase/integrase [Herbidospora cretacea]